MDERGIKALSDRVEAFIQAFLDIHSQPDAAPIIPEALLAAATFNQADVDGMHFYRDDAYVDFPALTRDEGEQFSNLVRVWAAKRFPGLSPEGAETRLERLVIDCLNDPDNIRGLCANLISSLEQQPVLDMYFPLTGIDLQVPEWRLAEGIRVVQMTQERFDSEILAGYEAAAKDRVPCYEHDRRNAVGIARVVERALVGTVTLVIRAVGDENTAQDMAEKRADHVVDALQFAAAVYHRSDWRTVIDWTGDVPASLWRFLAQVPVSGIVWPKNPGSRRGMLAPWLVNQYQLDMIQEHQVDRVVSAALAEDDSEHHSMIRRAVGAFADGERQRSVDGKKLSYTTVLDIFFSKKDTSDTTRAIREGVAFTMYPTSLEGAFDLAQFVNKVYESRSRTSHDFEVGVFEKEDLERLRALAYQLIGVMSRREPFTKDSLAAELEERRSALGMDYDVFKKLGRVENEAKGEPQD